MLDIDGSAAAAAGIPALRGGQPGAGVDRPLHGRHERHRQRRLGLKLHLPLANLHDTKVQGALQLQSNDVTLFPELPPIQAALGKIEFSEHGVNLNGIGASFLGGPLQLSGGTQRDGSIAIRMAGSATADGMRATGSLPALQRLAGKLSGGARFGGSVTVKDRQTQIVLDSTLAGLGVELPAPLNKPAADVLPLHFVLNGQPTGDNGVAHDEIRVRWATRWRRATCASASRTGRGS
jgi:uncharacterized protein YhdP